nr:Programmed cell death protein 10 [Hymenolepis microstoma]
MSRGSSSGASIPDPIKLTLSYNLGLFLRFTNESFKSEKMQADVGNVQRSFDAVERTLPGFTWNFLRGFMERFGIRDIPMYSSIVPHSYDLEKYAAELKLILSRIPLEIIGRNEFIDLIKQIAAAIKNHLDCIHSILNALPQGVIRQDLDGHMINFVDYSKRFSSALKGFFRDHKTNELYASANMLVQQTNLILLFIRNTR